MTFDALPFPSLTPAFDVTVDLAPPEVHGATSAGFRRVVPIMGGRISGSIDADLLPGGADWQLVRADGTIEVDARYSARTADGDLLLLHASGLRTGTPDVLDCLARGEDVDPHDYTFRTVVRIETASRKLDALQRSLFLASAERQANAVRYRAHRVG
ncbi:DUF3237 domain-containing protein [Microbacterium esteraromaticum]|uniref:DUF3237 domain-containing protein n=1 Tax=Microbacterium esteraromaticum TaxID=57043 RepID=UPI00195AED8B|nr:DUF3237 domain-containing protein [Microbacterium esteraromaticum]MBM7465620.1 hypothetical protein [Microbacterium esteraromaticum]